MLIADLEELGLPPLDPVDDLEEGIGDLLFAPLPLFGDGLFLIAVPPLEHFVILELFVEFELPHGDLLGEELHALLDVLDEVGFVFGGDHALQAEDFVAAGQTHERQLL